MLQSLLANQLREHQANMLEATVSLLRVKAQARGPAVGPIYRKQCKQW